MRPTFARAVGAVVRRDFALTRSYRTAFVLDIFFGVMNLIVFFYISKAVDLRAGDLGGASTYFRFASVGIVLTVVMQAATTGLAARLREEQLTGTLEMLVMQPLTPVQLAFGLTGFPFLFGFLRGALYVGFAAAFLDLGVADASIVGFLSILVATALALSAIGMALGGIVLVFKQGSTLAAVITFGMGLLSGALFPRGLLPAWVEAIGNVLPTRFALDGLRNALFEGSGWQGDLLALLVTAILLLPLSIWLFIGLLNAVKRKGSLSQY